MQVSITFPKVDAGQIATFLKTLDGALRKSGLEGDLEVESKLSELASDDADEAPKPKRGRPPKAAAKAKEVEDEEIESEEDEAEEEGDLDDEGGDEDETEEGDEEESEEDEAPKARKGAVRATKGLSLEKDVIPALRTYEKKHGLDKTKGLLRKFGVKSVRDLKEKQFAEVISAATKKAA